MGTVLAAEIAGLDVPDAGVFFLVVLITHVGAGLTAVVFGVLAATARKGPGRHPRAGRVYLCALGVLGLTAAVMAIIRWREDWRLVPIASAAAGFAVVGWWARTRLSRRSPHWARWHGTAMACSFVALFTGFYVDNGPQLPLWDQLPHVLYWLIPSFVGLPLTWRALIRFEARTGTPTARDFDGGSAAPSATARLRVVGSAVCRGRFLPCRSTLSQRDCQS